VADGNASGCWIESHKVVFGCQLTHVEYTGIAYTKIIEKVGEGLGTLPNKENSFWFRILGRLVGRVVSFF